MRHTLVTFHAHPDDEAIATGGVMAQAAELGHRVVLVVATRGEHGEVADGFLEPDEALWERRVRETEAAAAILGVERVEFLGYVDSGMMGEPTNDAPDSFWQADVDEAAARLARILTEVDASVLTIYDHNGNYGHPDHIQVHRVGLRAAQIAGTPQVFEATMNRDFITEMTARGRAEGLIDPEELPEQETSTLGLPATEITTFVDVRPHVAQKRRALAAHRSQVPDEHFFLAMPEEAFAELMGTEWFVHHGMPRGTHEESIWEWLDGGERAAQT